MADVQVEHGYTRIANELLEALVRVQGLPGRHLQVLLAVIRATYGWGVPYGPVTQSDLARATGIDRRDVHKIVRDLRVRRILEAGKDLATGRRVLRIQKDFDLWTASWRGDFPACVDAGKLPVQGPTRPGSSAGPDAGRGAGPDAGTTAGPDAGTPPTSSERKKETSKKGREPSSSATWGGDAAAGIAAFGRALEEAKL